MAAVALSAQDMFSSTFSGIEEGLGGGEGGVSAPEKTAFAVYSSDDGSLDFYKRDSLPEVGDVFEGKIVSEVYTGFENAEFKCIKAGSRGWEFDDDATADTPWFARKRDVRSVRVVDPKISPRSLAYWFLNFENCKTFDLENLDMRYCTSLLRTFNCCYGTETIELSTWVVGNVSDMTETFLNCLNLKSLDLSHWSTPSLNSMHSMFNCCTKIKTIYFGPGWDTRKVVDIACVFAGSGVETLDLSDWDTENITTAYAALYGCSHLETLNVSTWDTSHIENLKWFFKGDGKLQSINLGSWDLGSCLTAEDVFESCDSLTSIKVGQGWRNVDNGEFPTPSLDGADGKWYTLSDGTGYAPGDVPSGVADTYFATKALRDAAAQRA